MKPFIECNDKRFLHRRTVALENSLGLFSTSKGVRKNWRTWQSPFSVISALFLQGVMSEKGIYDIRKLHFVNYDYLFVMVAIENFTVG